MASRRTTPLVRSRRRRGFALVLVLWFVVLVFTIAVSLAYQMRVGLKMTSYGRKRLQAQGLARAGIGKAVVDLKNDRLMAIADQNYNNDTGDDIWARTDDKTDIPLGKGAYTVRVIDDNAKLDLNAITPGNRGALEYLLIHVCDVNDDVAREMTDAYLDYVDGDNAVFSQPDADEAEYYTEWAQKRFGDTLAPDYRFRPKNEPVFSVEELMQIPGFTSEILFGDPTKTPQDPIARADWEERSTALCDYLTAGTAGRVNVNTAPKPVLAAMLAAASGGQGNPENWADDMIDFREDQMKLSRDKAHGIMDPDQLQQSGVDPTVFGTMKSMFSLSQASQFFTIIGRGTVDGIQATRSMRVNIEVQRYPIDPEKYDGMGRRDPKGFGILKSMESFKVDPEVRVIRLSEL